MTTYPGQLERLTFTREHVDALASVPRAQVFWAFQSDRARSVREVAKEIGRPPQTVHYHVEHLLTVGLLLAAGVRPVRTKPETTYVHVARTLVSLGAQGDPEYRRSMAKGFSAIARTMAREYEDAQEAVTAQDAIGSFQMFRHTYVHLAAEQIERVRAILIEALNSVEEEQSPNGIEVHVAAFVSPTSRSSREWCDRHRPKRKR
ncbi:MAG: helix-turn-helix transcriptional regulator [Fimbriimonadaceae bacterium]|nr:helix-turn-helix transcriptional regulator [Fimbriimonadaceae bacterium]